MRDGHGQDAEHREKNVEEDGEVVRHGELVVGGVPAVDEEQRGDEGGEQADDRDRGADRSLGAARQHQVQDHGDQERHHDGRDGADLLEVAPGLVRRITDVVRRGRDQDHGSGTPSDVMTRVRKYG